MDIVFVINKGVLEVEPELYSKEKDAKRRVKELCDNYDVLFDKRHTPNIDIWWFADIEPDAQVTCEEIK